MSYQEPELVKVSLKQLVVCGNTLYGLDAKGIAWRYNSDTEEWYTVGQPYMEVPRD